MTKEKSEQSNGNEITTGSYHIRKCCELIRTYLDELHKDKGQYEYIEIPITRDEWELIYKRLKDY